MRFVGKVIENLRGANCLLDGDGKRDDCGVYDQTAPTGSAMIFNDKTIAWAANNLCPRCVNSRRPAPEMILQETVETGYGIPNAVSF